MSTIRLEPHPEGLKGSPEGYLDAEFANFLRAAREAGYAYRQKARGIIGSLERLPILIECLSHEGFRTDASALRESIGSHIEQMKARAAQAQARILALRQAMQLKGYAPFPFQEEGIMWLSNRKNALLADEMGLGKTIQALGAIEGSPPVLVICPKIAIDVWVKHFADYRPEYAITVLEGKKGFRWPEEGEVCIINYEILPVSHKEDPEADPEWLNSETAEAFASNGPTGAILIADECHRVKSAKSKRTIRFRVLAKAIRSRVGRTYGLTGTPLDKNPGDLWALLMAFNLVKESFDNYNNYRNLMGGKPGFWGGMEWGEPDPTVPERIKKVMLRRVGKDVLTQLPPEFPIQLIEVDADLKQADRKFLDQIDDRAGFSVDKEGSVTWNSKAISAEEVFTARKLLAEAKYPALVKFIEEFEEQGIPLVVASAHRKPVEWLGDRPGWLCIHGDTPNRAAVAEAFQTGKYKGIALSIRAAGEAITLTAANHMVFVDFSWTPGPNLQVKKRIHRIGQHQGCHFYALIANHKIDRRVQKLLAQRMTYVSDIVDASARVRVATSWEPLKRIYDSLTAAASLALPVHREYVETPTPSTPVDPVIIRRLREVLGNLSNLERPIAANIIQTFDNAGDLTIKQWRLAERILELQQEET